MKKDLKMFVVRKYIMASTLMEARRIEKTVEPLEIWIDEEWKNEQKKNLANALGFAVDKKPK